MNRRVWILSVIAAGLLLFSGCQQALLTAIILVKGTDVDPEFTFLLKKETKGEKRVAVASRSFVSNQYDIQNVPRDLTRQLCTILDTKVENTKLKVVEAARIEAWLDDCDNNFESYLEIGRDKKINADYIIGIDILGFQIRDPHSPHLMQGKCQVLVKAWDCKSGEVIAKKSLTVIDPPLMPLPAGASSEVSFRPQFIQVVAEQIGILFHRHDPHKSRRIDADNLEMHRMDQ